MFDRTREVLEVVVRLRLLLLVFVRRRRVLDILRQRSVASLRHGSWSFATRSNGTARLGLVRD
jgi:hypothetical protein